MNNKKAVLKSISDRIVYLSDITKGNQPILAVFYALLGEFYADISFQDRATKILSSLLSEKNISPWFYNGEQGLYWALLYLNKKGVLELTDSLYERILQFVHRFECTWGQIPQELYPTKFSWGDSFLLMEVWKSEESYIRYFIEELLIMRLDKAEQFIINGAGNKTNIDIINWLGCYYLIRFCVSNNIFPCKAEFLLSQAIIESKKLSKEISDISSILLGNITEFHDSWLNFDIGLHLAILNVDFPYNRVNTSLFLEVSDIDYLVGLGIWVLNELE